MERKRIWLTAALCLVLVVGVIVAGTLFGEPSSQPSQGSDAGTVILSEIMSNNRLCPDAQGQILDYIELYNPSDRAVDISNYKLSDNESTIGYTFPQGTVIAANSYLVCYCNPGGNSSLYAQFGISKDGETIYLYNSANVCIQTVSLPALSNDQPYIRASDGTWQAGTYGTPGFENTQEGYALWLEALGIPAVEVVFSEVQTANRSAILGADGQFCDWIELYNPADTPAVLDGYYLSDDPEDPYQWQIPQLTVAPGGYAVIPCGDGAGAPFGLSKTGCHLTLTGPVGNPITELSCPGLQEDRAWQLTEDGTYIETDLFSPGFENTQAGYESFLAARGVPGPLAIWEVMPANDRYLVQSDGECYDWVELKNISGEAINLGDYVLSDDSGMLTLFSLPDQTLQPGELVTVILSGNTQLTGRYIHAPFSLNRSESWLYVSHKETGLCDVMRIRQVPLLGTIGRTDEQILYFAEPTPGQENTGGAAAIVSDPFVQTPGGIYNDVNGVSVVLSGEGDIRYTLDGSVPTENSSLYTQPITLTKTTTVRAKAFSSNKLPSSVVTSAYIINENHTLPVLTVSVDPDQMFGYSGIYTLYSYNIEIPCNLTLYEDNGSFSVDCGIKMFGHTGLQMPKKSFKVNFRGRYGADLLSYPVYGEDGPEVYDSLVIRSGQDYPQSIFRDELFTNLCRQMSDNVLAQRDKFCILYINGEYRGIYCLKEAFSEFFYAQNRGVTEQSVDMVQAPVYPSSDIFQFMNYLGSHDMTDPDNYAYACTVFNMESLIDWIIIQGYSTNGDVQQNLRYFRSSDNGGTYEMAFYDLDWAFYYHLAFTDVLSNDREMNWQHLRITTRLMRNPTFRRQFLERVSYHMENTLSIENVLATIDYYEQLLDSEVPRERARWGGTYNGWKSQVNKLRRFITEWDHMGDMVRRLVRYIGLTQEEIDLYFRRWV